MIVLYFKAVRHYHVLTRGLDGRYDLSKILDTHLNRVEALSSGVSILDQDLRSLKKISQSHLCNVGLLRFNPFGDTGGDQSFALALLDGENTGIVISSLHGRSYSRMFGKPVKAGLADGYQLSTEEEQAVSLAMKNND